MIDGPMKFGAILLAHGMEVVDESGNSEPRAFTVRREEIAGLWASRDILVVRRVAPVLAGQVGLAAESDVTVAPPPVTEVDLIESGAIMLSEVRSAVTNQRFDRLRKLCSWFPVPALRMPEVHELLDSLPRPRAQQVAGLLPGRGRPASPAEEQLGLIVTIDLLVRKKQISVSKAACEIAAVPGAWFSAERLANLHADLGQIARCLNGYWVSRSEIPCMPWGESADDEFAGYVKESKG